MKGIIRLALFLDDLRQTESERGIGAGLQRHEQVGLLSDGVLVGVDDDELAIVILNRVGDVVPGVRPGHDGVMAPHDKGAHLGDEIHVDAALIVEAARRVHGTLREREVGGAVLVRELGHVLQTVEIVHVARLGSAVGEGAHAARAKFCLVLLDLRTDGVDGLVPADALPLTGATLGALGALHGVLDALLLHDERGDGGAAGAHALLVDGRALDLLGAREHHVAVAHHGLQRTTHAGVAVGRADLLVALGRSRLGRKGREPRSRNAARNERGRGRGLEEPSSR